MIYSLRESVCDISLLPTFHNGGSRASPAHGLRITILTGLLDRLTSIWRRLSPDSDEMPFSCYNYTLLLAGLLLILILVTEHRVPPPPSPLALPPPPQYIPQPTLKANAYTNETHTKKHGNNYYWGAGAGEGFSSSTLLDV